MAQCDRGHEPIQFEGSFSALCPLCAAVEKIRNETATAVREAEEALESMEDCMRSEERRADRAEEALREYKAAHPEASK